ALGAARGDVLWMVLREALWLALAGVAIGIPAAVAAGRVASSTIPRLLFGLSATDPATIAIASGLLVLVARHGRVFTRPARVPGGSYGGTAERITKLSETVGRRAG